MPSHTTLLQNALDQGQGILRLAANWVPRSFFRPMTQLINRSLVFILCCSGLLSATATLSAADSAPEDQQAPANVIKLPGIEIDAEKRIVDVAADVSLTEGLLELIACTKGTKEHEAIVRINALPIHVHTALLLIGARNGTPAMRKPINEEQTRWIHYRPSGDSIAVSLVVPDAEGKPVERPISDFIKRSEGDPYMQNMGWDEPAAEGEAKEKFPDVFLFTGSHLVGNEEEGRQYLADQSGHVITISTFGDELLGLADIQSQDNGELIWEVDSTYLPPLDTEIKLRLRPMSE